MERQNFFYGWYVLAVCFLMIFINYGLANGPLGIYLVSATTTLGISRTQFSMLYTFRSATMTACNLFFGSLVQRFGLRYMVFTGCCSIVLALLIFSTAVSGVSFYIGGLFLGLGFALSSTGAVSTLTRNWFLSRRGLLTGIILAASGAGSSVGSLLVERWISAFGWRASFTISACAVAAIAVLGLLIIRTRPADKGLSPFGSEADVKGKVLGNSGITFREAMHRPRFYIIMACMFFIGFLTNPVYTNVSPQIIDAGYGVELASSVISLLFIVLAVSKIVLGQIYDCVGFKRTLCICFGANSIGILLLLFATSASWYWAFAVIFSISLPLETLMMPFFVSTMFGERQISTFLGIALALSSLGMGLGNPIMSAFYDANGSYTKALILFLCISVTVFCLLLYFTNPRHSLAGQASTQQDKTTGS